MCVFSISKSTKLKTKRTGIYLLCNFFVSVLVSLGVKKCTSKNCVWKISKGIDSRWKEFQERICLLECRLAMSESSLFK